MARGPKKHLKRLYAPKHWMLGKMGGIWAPHPSAGPHKLRECLPLSLILRQRLKYALTRRETMMIVMRRLVNVDGKIRTDLNYPCGFMDVLSIPKTDEHFRLLFDVQGRFVLTPFKNKEDKNFKLCRVQQLRKGKKASIGHNPFHNGQMAAIPYAVTHDGRTLKYPPPGVKVHDTVKLDLTSGHVTDFIKFDVGATCMITRGKNIGRVGSVSSIERHPGSYDLVHLTDKNQNTFATRLENVFVVGKAATKPEVQLPYGRGLKLSLIEKHKAKVSKKAEKEKVAAA
jgi:small subunit ribosomal protein S4e